LEVIMSEQNEHRAPSLFFSYSWDSDAHKEWVADLGQRLASDGMEVRLDDWDTHLGDQLPSFMERAIGDSDYVLIICTPGYKRKSEQRSGGVGYEGNIITAELLARNNQRKFIPVLRENEWCEAAPGWLLGKKFVDLRGVPYSEENYRELVVSLHGMLPLPSRPHTLPDTRIQSAILKPEAVARRRVYTDFISETFKFFEAAKAVQVVVNDKGSGAQLIYPDKKNEFDSRIARIQELRQEIQLWSKKEVWAVALEIWAHVLAAQIAAMIPGSEEFDEAHHKFLSRALPRFREEIRKEAGLQDMPPKQEGGEGE
jgi:hypothetical protein